MTLKEAVRDYIFWAVAATQEQQQQAANYWIAQGYPADNIHVAPHQGTDYMALIVPHFVLHLRRPYSPELADTLLFPSMTKFREAVDKLAARRVTVPAKFWEEGQWVEGRPLEFFRTPGGMFIWDHGYISNADLDAIYAQKTPDNEPDDTV